MVKCNTKMKETLEQIGNIEKKPKHKLQSLLDVIWPDFIEVESCILINWESRKNVDLNTDFILEMFGDRTGFEASENHIHMIDCANEFVKNPLEGLKFALNLLEVWECKLKRDFPHYKFHLILTYDGTDSILRFHKYREEEGSWIKNNDLDGYKEECILVKEF